MANYLVGGGFFELNGAGYDFNRVQSTNMRKAAMVIDKLKTVRALMSALNGVAAGGAALDQYKRVANGIVPGDELSGSRVIETATNVNRVTVAGDITDIAADLLTYGGLDTAVAVANLDGNPLGTR